jgi:hypothetical protein
MIRWIGKLGQHYLDGDAAAGGGGTSHAVKAVVDKIEDLPEALRSLYVEQGGKWVLDVDLEEHPATHGALSALRKERLALRTANDELAKRRGIDPQEYEQLRREKEEREHAEAVRKGDLDKILKAKDDAAEKAKAQAEKEKAQLAADLAAERQARDTEGLTRVAVSALLEAKVLNGDPEVLLPHVLRRLRRVRDEKGVRDEVLDASGEVEYSGSGLKTVQQLVAEMRDSPRFAPQFEGSEARGSGSTGGTGFRPGAVTITKTDAANYQLYKAAKERARKAGQDYPTVVPG